MKFVIFFCMLILICNIFYVSSEFYRLVCYYNAVEAWKYRRGKGLFLPKDIDSNKCTNLHYAYAKIDPQTFLIMPEDEWTEIDNKLYQRVTDLRKQNPMLRILLSVGGWSESSEIFSKLVSNSINRKAFLTDVIRFLKLHDFDGLDIAWFFPVCWNGDCESGNKCDKKHFSQWIKEMREEFDTQEPRLLLTVTMPHDSNIVKRAYDVQTLLKFDYINVMTFDYAPDWLLKTGHNAPLYAYRGSNRNNNVNATMIYYTSLGIPRNKLIMAIPTFGRSHTLQSSDESSIGAPVIGPGKEGEYTRTEGLMASYEICNRIIKKGWIKSENSKGYPYTYLDDQWISYDDDDVASSKAKYIIKEKFGGALIWDIDRDDFKGSCNGIKYPLTTAVANELYGSGKSASYPHLRSDRYNKFIVRKEINSKMV